jgi:hypothetical protein
MSFQPRLLKSEQEQSQVCLAKLVELWEKAGGIRLKILT